MTRKLLRSTLIGLIALVALGAVANAVAPDWFAVRVVSHVPVKSASADFPVSKSECELAGVTLVVEQSATSNPLVRCVAGFRGTGWELFGAAKVAVAGTEQYPQGFVCRIAGYPSVSKQSCNGTPTLREGTWTYWFATATTGEKWHLAMQGAAARKPLCGDVEAWVFSTGGNQPAPKFVPEPLSCVID